MFELISVLSEECGDRLMRGHRDLRAILRWMIAGAGAA
jgi:hypothetical protein